MSPSTAPLIVGPILAVDAVVSRAIHTAAKPFLPPFLLLLLEISADFRFSFPVSLSLLLSPPLRPFLIPFLLGLLIDLIFVGIVKLIFRRARPAYNHPSMSAAVSADHYSFPSGHASRVFFVAASVHFFSSAVVAPVVIPSYSFLDGWVRDHQDGDVKGEVVVAVWIWAAVTAISRILLGRHYVLDVAAGACLGILEALFALRFLRLERIFGIERWLPFLGYTFASSTPGDACEIGPTSVTCKRLSSTLVELASCFYSISAGNSVDSTEKAESSLFGKEVNPQSQYLIDVTFSSDSSLQTLPPFEQAP